MFLTLLILGRASKVTPQRATREGGWGRWWGSIDGCRPKMADILDFTRELKKAENNNVHVRHVEYEVIE